MSERLVSDQERAQKVIRRAIELMRLGQAKGWSHALALARAEVRS